jgi:DNA-binding beta-propeller fold protein YncE
VLKKFSFTFALCLPLAAATISTLDTGPINNPYGLVIGPDHALYFCEIGNHRISRFDFKTQQRTTVVGTGEKGFSGAGGPATKALVNEPYEIRFNRQGDLFFVDMPNAVVQRVDRKTGILTTVAGTGTLGFSGDGGPATQAQLRQPHSIAFTPNGRNLLICDIANNRIRRLDLVSGIIDTYAGTGEKQPTPEGAQVANAPLNGPRAIDFDSRGNLYLALREGNAIYRIDPKSQKIFRVAGTGEKGYTGDGGDAKLAKLNGPKGVSCGPRNLIYIADTENHVIRQIDPKTGIITTLAGTGARGVAGTEYTGADPKKCPLARPHGVYVDRTGLIYIGDSEMNRIRVVHP